MVKKGFVKVGDLQLTFNMTAAGGLDGANKARRKSYVLQSSSPSRAIVDA